MTPCRLEGQPQHIVRQMKKVRRQHLLHGSHFLLRKVYQNNTNVHNNLEQGPEPINTLRIAASGWYKSGRFLSFLLLTHIFSFLHN